MTTEVKEQYVSPRVNVIDNVDTVLIEAELPGVPNDGVELEVKDDELTLTGHRKRADGPGQALITERRTRDYRRRFVLSRSIETGNIGAQMRDGVLTVTLPKSGQFRPRRIPVS